MGTGEPNASSRSTAVCSTRMAWAQARPSLGLSSSRSTRRSRASTSSWWRRRSYGTPTGRAPFGRRISRDRSSRFSSWRWTSRSPIPRCVASNAVLSLDKDIYRLVIVDEAHALRNPDTTYYHALDRLLGGTKKDLVLLTATPVNNALWDLYHPGHAVRASRPGVRRTPRDRQSPGLLRGVRGERTGVHQARGSLPAHGRCHGTEGPAFPRAALRGRPLRRRHRGAVPEALPPGEALRP